MSLEKLIKGFRAFRASYFVESDHYVDLVRKGQIPETLVIACSDSRNDPALMTQSKPGDMFVVRNVAAIVPPYQPDNHYHGTSAAIEFAVKGLKIKHIIVLGHALCGGVQALGEQGDASCGFEFISQWIMIGADARKIVDDLLPAASQETRRKALEQAMILTSLNNLMTFPWIRSGVASRQITLHGWYFDMTKGKLLGYDFISSQFREVGQEAEGFTGPIDPKDSQGALWPLHGLIETMA